MWTATDSELSVAAALLRPEMIFGMISVLLLCAITLLLSVAILLPCVTTALTATVPGLLNI